MGKKNDGITIVETTHRITIDFAVNGVVVGNPYDRSDVSVGKNIYPDEKTVDHDDVYRVIGEKIYDWVVKEMAYERGLYRNSLNGHTASLDMKLRFAKIEP